MLLAFILLMIRNRGEKKLSTSEIQNNPRELFRRIVVNAVSRAFDHDQPALRQQTVNFLNPTLRNYGVALTTHDERWLGDARQLILNLVLKRIAKGLRRAPQTGLQVIQKRYESKRQWLARNVQQQARELLKDRSRLPVNGRRNQYHSPDEFGAAKRKVNDDLTAYRVGKQARAAEVVFSHPGSERIGQLRDVERAARALASARSRKIERVNAAVGSEPLGQRDHVAAGDAKTMYED
jgi:hypothetical protein